jgi:hypothetical protein
MVAGNGRPVQRLTQRHPFAVLAIGLAVLAWMAWYEISKITTSRHTVPHGWAAGLAAGVAASVVMTALIYMALRISRRTPGRPLRLVAILVSLASGSAIVGLRISYPLGSGQSPYLVTTGINVAVMAYVATFAVICVALLIWAGTRLARKRRAAQHTSGIPARQP